MDRACLQAKQSGEWSWVQPAGVLALAMEWHGHISMCVLLGTGAWQLAACIPKPQRLPSAWAQAYVTHGSPHGVVQVCAQARHMQINCRLMLGYLQLLVCPDGPQSLRLWRPPACGAA